MKSGSTAVPASVSCAISVHAKNGSSWPTADIPAGMPDAVSSVAPGTRAALPSHDIRYAAPRPIGSRSHLSSGNWSLAVAAASETLPFLVGHSEHRQRIEHALELRPARAVRDRRSRLWTGHA
eukprot:scaffold25520_cov60-Phaeocystis_antarctica.AAC.3